MNTKRYMIPIFGLDDFNKVAIAAKKLGYEFYLNFDYLRNPTVLFLTPTSHAEWSNRPVAHYRNSPYINVSVSKLEEIAGRKQ
ncbi:hypothetical protein N5J31_01440 [Acinetobacter johnsonii]|uniref:hypothetical protein n=1 Tax=Acinetobacter johnsonii TaxID=40214 RepID=UPI0024472F5B|nr:hypothetical protein [Acinetobacter johnsonii]MDH2045589.1 hypothetical protein [Acinetobacter johnsonii]